MTRELRLGHHVLRRWCARRCTRHRSRELVLYRSNDGVDAGHCPNSGVTTGKQFHRRLNDVRPSLDQ